MDRKLLAETQGLVGSLRKSGSSLCYPHGLQWEKGLDVLASHKWGGRGPEEGMIHRGSCSSLSSSLKRRFESRDLSWEGRGEARRAHSFLLSPNKRQLAEGPFKSQAILNGK